MLKRSQPVNRYGEKFKLDQIPNWTCPKCNNGVLILDVEHYLTYENSKSKSLREEIHWEPTFIRGGFYGQLICNNSDCKDIVAFVGDTRMHDDGEYFPEYGAWEPNYKEYLYPKFFDPPIHIFQLSKDIPDLIKDKIILAFSIFWHDLGSCVHLIHDIIQLILNELKVKNAYALEDKHIFYSLYQRLEFIGSKNNEITELLMSIKWITNGNELLYCKLYRDHILQAFNVLDKILKLAIPQLPKTIKNNPW